MFLVLPEHLQQPTEQGRFHISFDEGFGARNMIFSAQRWRRASLAFQPSLPLFLLPRIRAGLHPAGSSNTTLWGITRSSLITVKYFHHLRAHDAWGSGPTCVFTWVDPSCTIVPWFPADIPDKTREAVYTRHAMLTSFSLVRGGTEKRGGTEAQGDGVWLKWVIRIILVFSLGSPALEASCSQVRIPMSRCCSFKPVSVREGLQKQQTISKGKCLIMNSEKWFEGDEHSYMIERKMAHPCLLQCLLTLQMFSCKSVDAASFLALTCWLNTPLLLWIAAVICWCLPALQGEGTSWRERDRSVPRESRMLKSLVCIVGSGMQFLNCLHCLTEEFFLPTSAPWLFSIMCIRRAR